MFFFFCYNLLMEKMKLTTCLLSLLLMTGCYSKNVKTEDSSSLMDEYETYYVEVQSNGHYESTSKNFDLSTEMTQVEDGTYRYYVILDNPKTAMYNVMMIACENDVPYEECDKMVPSFGIFEERVSLVPGQINTEDGYVRGISISGETDDPQVSLKLLVRWKDSDGKNRSEYIETSLSYEGGNE